MLRNTFNPKKPYRAVAYLRMSSDLQNPRSPDQQLAEIQRVLKAQGVSWKIVNTYRDEGKSGRYVRKRDGFQEMLRDIRSRSVEVDLILVDTFERFGRADEIAVIRKELFDRHGVLVLTADSHFGDPNSPQGRALGMVEAMRSTEDGRIKSHNVVRGKRDAVCQGHWPGGAAPFGYKLDSVMKDVHGRQDVDYCKLVPDPRTNWIVKLALDKAYQDGLGQTRLARFLNEHPDIPPDLKPFQPTTVGYWIDNPIYSGELVWAENCTGIVDDMRVKQRNPEEEVVRMPNFCEPTIPREQQEEIQRLRRKRGEKVIRALARARAVDGKLIAPPAPGMTLKYPLTGLVRCGHCGRAMNPTASKAYVTKSGEERRYVAYGCPGAVADLCDNSTKVPEPWLRTEVIGAFRHHFFPDDDSTEEPEWLASLFEEVRQALGTLSPSEPNRRDALQKELEDLRTSQAGWSKSLAKPDLDPDIREEIEATWKAAKAREREIVALQGEESNRQERLSETLDKTQVLACLKRLPEILAQNNPTRTNLELSLHIDRIDCFDGGKVVMRTCKLGALPNTTEMLAKDMASPSIPEVAGAERTFRANPRRRARLRVEGDEDTLAAVDIAADPYRFAGLDEQWFWEDVFQIPERLCWAEEHAAAVAAARARGLTHESLARLFGVTTPTIRKALRYAYRDEASPCELPQKMPRARWQEDHALDVLTKKREGLNKAALAAHFGKSKTTIQKALDYAMALRVRAITADVD